MIEFLKKVPLFENLSMSELDKIRKVAKSETHAKDTVMFSEGDPGKRCYVIIKGQVRISKFIPNIGEGSPGGAEDRRLFRRDGPDRQFPATPSPTRISKSSLSTRRTWTRS